MDPSAPSHWYRKRQLPTGDDSPVDEGLIGSMDKPRSSVCSYMAELYTRFLVVVISQRHRGAGNVEFSMLT